MGSSPNVTVSPGMSLKHFWQKVYLSETRPYDFTLFALNIRYLIQKEGVISDIRIIIYYIDFFFFFRYMIVSHVYAGECDFVSPAKCAQFFSGTAFHNRWRMHMYGRALFRIWYFLSMFIFELPIGNLRSDIVSAIFNGERFVCYFFYFPIISLW